MIYIPRRGLRRVGRGPGVVPSAGGEAFNAMEPAGLTTLGDKVWTNGTSSEFSIDVNYSGGGYPDVPSAPEGGKAAQINFPDGFTAGYRGSIQTTAQPEGGYVELFTVAAMRVSAGWVEDVNGTKFLYPPLVGPEPKPFKPIFSCLRPFPGDNTKFSWYFVQQEPDNVNRHCNANGYTEAAPFPCDFAYWWRVSEYYRMNSAAGVADGCARLWVSAWDSSKWLPSVLILDYNNIELNVRPFLNAYWDIYRGGGGSPAVVGDQYMQFNRTYAAGKVAS